VQYCTRESQRPRPSGAQAKRRVRLPALTGFRRLPSAVLTSLFDWPARRSPLGTLSCERG
jgi:hypothetical protein